MNSLQDKPYRLIAFDIDGTIVDAKQRLCEHLKPVVHKLIAKGYMVTLVSARHPQAMLDIANQLGILGEFIALNGSFITNSKLEVVYSKTFEIEHLVESIKLIDANLAINYYHHFDWFVQNLNPYVEIEYQAYGFPYQVIEDSPPQIINKLTLIGHRDSLFEAQEIFAKNNSVNAVFSSHNYLEVMCQSISKFNALKEYASRLGIEPSQIIAFGDGENDIPMLLQVGLGVAMRNAHDIVKQNANDVTAFSCDEAGVARYLENLISKGIL